MNYNKTLLAGNLTRDPEIKFTAKGSAIANFTIAHNRKWRTEAGEDKEEVSFIDCVVFGKTAENVAKFFKKGSAIFVEGRLKQESWDDKATGQKRSKLVVIVESFQFVGGKRDDAPARTQTTQTASQAGSGGEPKDDDDVPF